MANIKSSKQDIIKSRERHARNQARKGQMRGSIRRARAAIQAGGDDAVIALRGAISMIDRAASRGSIHPNAAARRKSRLVQKLNASQAASS